jgi:hypothetical protein
MLHNVLETEWILKVADIAARLKTGLETVPQTSEFLLKINVTETVNII